MINAPETRISVPPEPIANQIVQDPIFGHLSTMWNNIETSEELSLRHHTNQAALVQGAASVGIPIDVMRKTMERVADQYGEDLANRLIGRLQRPESMTTSVLRPAAPAPGAGGVSVGTGPMTADAAWAQDRRLRTRTWALRCRMRSAMVGTEAPGTLQRAGGHGPARHAQRAGGHGHADARRRHRA
jgi:hypothetical protein